MLTLRWYLIKSLLNPAVGTMVVLLSIIWLLQSLRFLDLMVNKGLSIATFFHLSVYLIPSLLMIILPLAFFIGACMGLKRLDDDKESQIFWAIGLTPAKLASLLVGMGVGVVFVGYVISLWLLPAGRNAMKDLQHQLRTESGPLLLEEGTFNQMGNDIMVYVKHRHSPTNLQQILVHDSRKQTRPVTWMAEAGEVIIDQDGSPQLLLKKGIRQEVGESSTSVLSFKQHTIDIIGNFQPSDIRWRDAEERFLLELTQTSNLSEKHQMQFKNEFHRRLIWPLSPIPLLLIAVLFLLRPAQNRKGAGRTTLIAGGVGIGYQVITMVLNNMGNRAEVVIYAQWAWPILVTAICCYLIGRRNYAR